MSDIKRKREVSAERLSPARLLRDLSAAITTHASDAVFAINGKIKAEQDSTDAGTTTDIRWDSSDPSLHKVSFPPGQDDLSQRALTQLLQDCQPATFGRGAREVLDPTYRQAAKMDVTAFCTTFDLAQYSIMHTLQQVLVCNDQRNDKHHGLRAELYKLNVYSGPTGRFKAHVDTPRSALQIGSLVVCLPHPHQGGELVVRHAGREVTYDWSQDSASIHWAAFFSDCEHEVLPVVQGHRVTLTYNLYLTDAGPARMATDLKALDQTSLLFYQAMKRLLQCRSFLPHGGLVGFACAHAYPHTSSSASTHTTQMLKGIDMLVYQTFCRLNGSAQVRAVLDGSEYETRDSGNEEASSDSDPDAEDEFGYLASKSYLTSFLFPPTLHDACEEEESLDPASIIHQVSHNHGPYEYELAFPRTKVTWLNGPPTLHSELAAAFLTYGNQPAMDAYYSAAVITCKIPGFEDRNLDAG